MSRLLLLEDDTSLGETLKERFLKENYLVEWATTCSEAIKKINQQNFDLVILDVSLPDGSGFDVAAQIRKTKTTPFIFMTALNSAEHRLAGYEAGAEEFIPKPFHLKEILIRVKHVLENHSKSSEIICGQKKIDMNSMCVIDERGGKHFLQSRDFQVLKLLIEKAPAVLSRDEILDLVWGEDKFPSHRTVDNSIVRLRAVLEDADGEYIRSVRGVGYQWMSVKS